MACRYTPAIEATNEKLKAYARVHTRVDFVDCTAPFLEDDDKACFRLITLDQPCSHVTLDIYVLDFRRTHMYTCVYIHPGCCLRATEGRAARNDLWVPHCMALYLRLPI